MCMSASGQRGTPAGFTMQRGQESVLAAISALLHASSHANCLVQLAKQLRCIDICVKQAPQQGPQAVIQHGSHFAWHQSHLPHDVAWGFCEALSGDNRSARQSYASNRTCTSCFWQKEPEEMCNPQLCSHTLCVVAIPILYCTL